ncbi:MAG TPA: tRNA (N(6)-L-threonylcarbamoyladenosine(37)-C(2))-methylthiotransferase MtaB [Chitinophagales bacterium]|nr:tRNA (N(6)-L-threonylcarbamoyladenosine(37)-C(2))-methylthiotransferase MtaB [Chitinophagales bacterium]HRK26413.1 tRNA (N(6)-L-threonylcarbamoyladenosine(37)-C(2))-methylthiotransferase MtaB [Chitinophagales bacterium]
MKKVAFYTLGCKLNYSETSAMGRLMADNGFETVLFHQQPDVYVINTCSVTDNADKKCRKVIKEALKYSPNARIVIVGCYAQLKPQEIAQIQGVDLVLGAAEKFNIPAHLQTLTYEPKGAGRFVAGNIKEVNIFTGAYSIGERTRSFLKVQDGCDYKCAFCTIPLARGASRSNTIANVVRNAHEIVEMGVKEIVLTGVNIGDYGKQLPDGEPEVTFFDLVQALEQVPVPRIRISSIEPNLLTNEIINFVAKSNRFMPHFHIPLQSGSNKILRLMRRRYARELYAERVAAIKQLMPHCCIGVDVIVGFPSETHEDFLDTYNFLNQLDVSYLHVFTYSERANTHALTIEPAVPMAVRNERSRMLHILSDKKRRHFYSQHLHTTRPALFEAETDGNTMYGFTDNYIKITAPYDPLSVNEICPVRLTHLLPDNLMLIEHAAEEVRHW